MRSASGMSKEKKGAVGEKDQSGLAGFVQPGSRGPPAKPHLLHVMLERPLCNIQSVLSSAVQSAHSWRVFP